MNEMVRAPAARDTNFHTAEYDLLYNEIGLNFRLSVNVAIYALIANGFIIFYALSAAQFIIAAAFAYIMFDKLK